MAKTKDDAAHRSPSVEDGGARIARGMFMTAAAAIGAIVALFASALWRPEVGALATTAITVVGAIVGATAGVAAFALGGGRRSQWRD